MTEDKPTRLLLSRFNALVLVRHGNTSQAPRDFDRPLSDKGRAQCVRVRTTGWLPNVARDYRIQLVIHSSARRCGETINEILKGQPSNAEGQPLSLSTPPPPKLVSESAIYDDILQPQAKGLYASCGHAPISDYFQQPGGREFLLSYADKVLSRLVHLSRSDSSTHSSPSLSDPDDCRGSAMVVVGHSIYLNALAYRLAEEAELPDKDMDLALHSCLDETDGFLLTQDPAAPAMQLLSATSRGTASHREASARKRRF